MTTYEHEESMPLGRQEVTRSSSCSVRSKRILIVAGQARSLVNFRGPLLRELRDRGLEVHVAAPRVTDAPVLSATLGDWGIIVHDIPLNRDGLNPLQDLHSLYLLGRLLHSVKPGTLLAYTIKPVIYATLAGWMVGVPRRFALITGMGYAFTDDPGGRRAGVQRVVTFLYSRALRRAHRVFFQNPDDQALCREKGLLPEGISSQVVNGSGVDLDYFGCAPLPEGPPVFLLIARLIADKGIRQYVEAARIVRQRHGKVRFLLLGGMDDKPGAVRQEELDAWNREGVIEYLGYLEDVRPVITMASVFVLPSYYREGTPRTALESMAMGRAIITSDAPGCRETVVEGHNGYLVPLRCVDALAEAMERFVVDPTLAGRLGKASRRLAEKKYDVRLVNSDMMRGMGL